jgi:hypothetical protein
MLQELGGAPFKITSDNPKCFVLRLIGTVYSLIF